MTFQEKAKQKRFTTPMSEEAAKNYIYATLNEFQSKDKGTVYLDSILEEESIFPFKVLQTRIDKGKLPIRFTLMGALAAVSLADGNIGKVVTILIDCLTVYKDQDITASKISELYPWGFYNEETFEDYVDNYLKERKCEWSYLY